MMIIIQQQQREGVHRGHGTTALNVLHLRLDRLLVDIPSRRSPVRVGRRMAAFLFCGAPRCLTPVNYRIMEFFVRNL